MKQERIKASDLHAKIKKPPKYRNKKITWNGAVFDSHLELKRWKELLLLQKAGRITELRRQFRIPIEAIPTDDVDGTHPVTLCVYVADAAYIEDGQFIAEDCKSEASRTQVYQLKAKILKLLHGIEIREIMK